MSARARAARNLTNAQAHPSGLHHAREVKPLWEGAGLLFYLPLSKFARIQRTIAQCHTARRQREFSYLAAENCFAAVSPFVR